VKARADELVGRFTVPESWQICSVAGSKGERAYAWAWISTTSARHYLLVREHLATGEPAYHYCYLPPDRPVQMMTLVRVTCLRWSVEEDFEFGKDHFGLDHSQVRLYTALLRHRADHGRLSRSARSPPRRKPVPQHRSCPPHPTSNHHEIPA
jgi:hypothetical protein